MDDSSGSGFWAGGPGRLEQSLAQHRSKVRELDRLIGEATSQTERALLERDGATPHELPADR